jgi:hypothetical protein
LQPSAACHVSSFPTTPRDAGFEKGIEVSFDEDAREPPLNRRGYNGAAGFRRFDNGEVAMIEVRRISEGVPLDFEVVVREGEGETRHHVTMSREMCERLTAGKHTPERCLEAAFRFLLDREPKESILGRFDVTVISRYFPEFERELPHYLSRS